MPSLKTKARIVCARNSKLIDGVRFCVVILCSIVGSGLSVFSLTRIEQAERMAEMKASAAAYVDQVQRGHDEAMREKDARLADKDTIITTLTDKIGAAAQATHSAAEKVQGAAKTAESASRAATKAVEEVMQHTPPAKPERPVLPDAPDWLNTP